MKTIKDVQKEFEFLGLSEDYILEPSDSRCSKRCAIVKKIGTGIDPKTDYYTYPEMKAFIQGYLVGKYRSYPTAKNEAKNLQLYHHKTDGGAEYLTDKFILCPNGHKEGIFEGANYVVRIDGDITKDAELTVK
jgi:hypothetical protein